MTTMPPAAPEGPLPEATEDFDLVGESRLPMVLAVIATMLLASIPPARFTIGPLPLFPTVVMVLLVVLILGDPGRIDRRSRWLRNVSLVLVGVLVLGAIGGTALLVVELVNGSEAVQEAGPLLVYTAKVWVGNSVAFALLYWNMDRGGPAERVHRTKRYPDFVFPQMSDESLAGPDWRPRFIDYLYIGFTNANAFSPTDALPLTGKAKMAMQTQALISYTILALALARVINTIA